MKRILKKKSVIGYLFLYKSFPKESAFRAIPFKSSDIYSLPLDTVASDLGNFLYLAN
jgi:hypothetical protein